MYMVVSVRKTFEFRNDRNLGACGCMYSQGTCQPTPALPCAVFANGKQWAFKAGSLH